MKSSGFFILLSLLASHQISFAQFQISGAEESDVYNSENLIAQNSIPSMSTEVASESLGQTSETVNAQAQVSENQKNELFYICKRDKDTRWLRAFKTDNGRCKTHYSKEGYVQVVSSASYFSSCEAVLNTVKKNIEEGQFKCEEKLLNSFIEIE